MKKITYLKPNGTIALVAPSFGCTTEPYKTRLDVAIKNLKEDGFNIVEGKNIYRNDGVVSSAPAKERAEEFMEAYLDPQVDAIISVGGGELMCEMLPYVDFNKIKESQGKLFMGFSDNTNLTYTLTTICEVPTIYGVNAPSLAFKPYKMSALDSLNLLMGKTKSTKGYKKWQKEKPDTDNPLAPSIYKEKTVIQTNFRKEAISFEGRMIGGNLDILANICGTKYDHTKEYINKYKKDGFIWFLEACDLSPLSIRRAIFELKEAGWFKHCKGFLIGRPLCAYGQEAMGVNQYNAVKDILKDLRVPILLDVDLGHFDPSMPIITGMYAKVDYKNNNFTITYKE